MEQLNKGLRDEERIFKLKEAKQLKDDSFRIDLLINATRYDSMLTDELKYKVTNIVKNLLPKEIKFKINYIKTITESKYVLKSIMDYIYIEAPTIYTNLQSAEFDVEIKSDIIVNITLEKYLYNYMQESKLHEKIEQYIGLNFMEEGVVKIFEIPNSNSIERKQIKIQHNEIRIIDIDVISSYYGTIAQNPRYIMDVSNKEFNQLTVCGVISNVKTKYIERIDKTIYSFLINDTTGSIQAKFFAKVNKRVKWEDSIKDGETLVIAGEYKLDNFENKLVLGCRCISKCSIAYNSINAKSDFFTENENYINIIPEHYEDAVQDDLFTEIKVNEDLLNKTYVVFDLETTGVDRAKDKIIELGAVKIEKGKIVESFSCLVNPECPIPEGASAVNGIYDDMVSDKLTFKEIVGDFYKFTRNATLVAHNAPFDVGILTRQGTNEKYDFDNSYIDTLVMARQMLNLSKFNLGFLCKSLNIELEGAHRALNDTVATAKLFIKLMNMK
jgi:DNA polymerase-3 subunit alpha (Gram-positive type)